MPLALIHAHAIGHAHAHTHALPVPNPACCARVAVHWFLLLAPAVALVAWITTLVALALHGFSVARGAVENRKGILDLAGIAPVEAKRCAPHTHTPCMHLRVHAYPHWLHLFLHWLQWLAHCWHWLLHQFHCWLRFCRCSCIGCTGTCIGCAHPCLALMPRAINMPKPLVMGRQLCNTWCNQTNEDLGKEREGASETTWVQEDHGLHVLPSPPPERCMWPVPSVSQVFVILGVGQHYNVFIHSWSESTPGERS